MSIKEKRLQMARDFASGGELRADHIRDIFDKSASWVSKNKNLFVWYQLKPGATLTFSLESVEAFILNGRSNHGGD